MKKLFALIAILGMLTFGASTMLMAQEVEQEATEEVAEETAETVEVAPVADEEVIESTSMHAAIKTKFIEGGAGFMAAVAICLILGLAVSIERVIYLNLSDTNTKKIITGVEEALSNGGVEAAKEFCRNTRGPVASIFYQGLLRYDHGMDMVEKTVVSYGSVQMGLMEKGLTWIGLFIAIAPMLGFLGTVIGMIGAFDAIQAAGDMSPTLVAGGIKVALITTVAGLIVAIILQVFFNYCTSKVEGIVNNMEDASVSLLDILVKFNQKNS
ncbi:MotA/TolQ/ExbB proton channel family protein [Odoribacter sp. OttesenSCG-928-J03]|nr:MotA/TolQ/ExbB proton channel family protein [Odoribacter sp. OttesenSCG-928-J03]MDL2330552.1 MotA/TolQ/ExbB proton channel family protein [Odoribacter sp. OttesenSCG-928-A06]